MPASPGSHIAGYRVVSSLGSGGMGDVYVVENEQLQRREAMKVISVGGASNADFQQRFTNEARTAASLDHPSIITVHSYGVADGLPWFTMSYLRGPDLASTQLSPAEAVTVIGQVADGLDYAHARTVIHRDIKPANIVVTRNDDGAISRAVMLDFGIAKLADSPQLTAVNSVVGTAAYTAPEIISGQPASALSDQYSLACTAYQLFSGAAPFKADTTTALMMAHIQTPPPMLGQVRLDLAPLGPVLARAMSKDPAARFPNCRAFADELKRAFGQTQVGTVTAVAGVLTPAPQSPAPYTPAPPFGQGPTTTPPPGFAAGPRPATTPQPGMTSQPGMNFQPGVNSQPGMQPQAAFNSQPGMNPPGFGQGGIGGPPSGPGMPAPVWGPNGPQPQAKNSRKGLWVTLALVAVALIAVAGTSPLWWPQSDSGPAPIAHPDRLIAVDSGSACAVQKGSLFCWGSNDYGEVGDGSSTKRATPVKVPGLTNVTAVSIGNYRSTNGNYPTTSCAIADGDVYCWGANLYGQVGDGSTDTRLSPVKVPGLSKSTAVHSSMGVTCAISVDEELFCWGGGEEGLIGTGNTAKIVATPQKVSSLTKVKDIDGDGTMCAIATKGDDEDALFCWGTNGSGQLGDGTTTSRTTPTKVQNLTNVSSVSSGSAYDSETKTYYRSTCAVSEKKVFCWGEDIAGTGSRTVPVEVSSITDATQVTTDVVGACAISDEKAQCWGNNRYGQAGNGNTEDLKVPTPVSTIKNVAGIQTGQSSTCAIDSNDDVYCWGASSRGTIGNPSADAEKQMVPMKVNF